ncbi:ABC transporter ATP-binding protein [Rurimicrobium arvi]|uniref:ABC transporter ATP-binding protein n=1 Tax=Rurimicrobium arvi TaxID=2049916 RepID=A0ABP8MMT2_9BACT
MVTVRNLVRRFGALSVVNDVSLDIAKGELVAITGASGAGKSTLLHLMGALDSPDGGTVRINGVDVFGLSAKKQAKFRNEQLGFVFQFHHLLPEFTAIENVAMPVWIAGKSRQEGLDRAQELLELVGLGARTKHKPSALSGGEQQRVAIARALANKPAVIMADEPTGNLDSANAEAVHNLFVDLQRQLGQTFILVTHNTGLAAMADRHLEMRDGRIVSESRDRGA